MSNAEKVKKGTWGKKKRANYTCTQCNFAHADKALVEQHYDRRHAGKAAQKPVSQMNVAELEAHADALGIDRSAIEGTGNNGAVVKADLLAAIEAAAGNG